jgi:diguanylate cyclase (GGDEF)-like protein
VADHAVPGPHTAGKSRYRSRSYLAVPILARGVDSAESGAVVGVFCATERLGDRPFTSGDGDLLAVIASATGAALVAADLREALALDALTGIASRPYCEARLTQEIKMARGGESPLSVLMVDIDHFKRVNDTLGHATGDRVLACVGQVLAAELRGDDVAARWGGEEFVVLLPGASAEEAAAVAERLRTQVQAETAALEGGAPVTVSIGIAQWRDGESPSEIVGRADAALYESKRGGRDRVTAARPK